MYLPPQVIEHLVRYIHEGCELEIIIEEFNGQTINRWIANGRVVLWSAPETTE